MLLTGGQISAAISSFIVFVFTSALFLSGYILQQRTVHNIQTVLHPPPPPEPTEPPLAANIPISDRRQHILSSTSNGQINWRRTAYAQIVRQHDDVCAAVMQFAELTRSKSPAQKALLYPSSWDDEIASGEEVGVKLRTSIRLLQKASKQYKVSLIPINPSTSYGEVNPGEEEAAYPLARMLTLTHFDRVLNLLPTGLVLDASLLDSLFTTPMNTTASILAGDSSDQQQGVLLRPSMAMFQNAAKLKSKGNKLPPGMTRKVSLQGDRPWMLSQTSSLVAVPALSENGFNATDFYDMAAYVRFDDHEILGPEFDVPGRIVTRARPKNGLARGVWEAIYDRFRMERMSVCGLDAVPMPKEREAEADA